MKRDLKTMGFWKKHVDDIYLVCKRFRAPYKHRPNHTEEILLVFVICSKHFNSILQEVLCVKRNKIYDIPNSSYSIYLREV